MTANLLMKVNNNEVVTDSLNIAEVFGRRHADVLNSIKKLGCSEEFTERNFSLSEYEDNTGRKLPKYYMTKDGFVFLVMGFTGDKATQFKEEYIKQFNLMQEALRIKQSSEWLQTRKQGKLVRRNETDVIAELVEYAKGQGSKNAHMFYINYSKMVNKAVGIESGQREYATEKVLSVIATIEDNIIARVKEDMENEVYYKSIYQHCKEEAEGLMKYMRLPAQRLLLMEGEQ